MTDALKIFLVGAELFGLAMVVIDLTGTASRVEKWIAHVQESWIERPAKWLGHQLGLGVKELAIRYFGDPDYQPDEDEKTNGIVFLILLASYLLIVIGTYNLVFDQQLFGKTLDSWGAFGAIIAFVVTAIAPIICAGLLATAVYLFSAVFLRFPIWLFQRLNNHPKGTLGGLGLIMTVGAFAAQRLI